MVFIEINGTIPVGWFIQRGVDKNHEKPLASFEAQGHAAGLNAEPVCLIGMRSPLILSAAVGARPLQTPQGKNIKKPVRPCCYIEKR